jgi:hypothetical protein
MIRCEIADAIAISDRAIPVSLAISHTRMYALRVLIVIQVWLQRSSAAQPSASCAIAVSNAIASSDLRSGRGRAIWREFS